MVLKHNIQCTPGGRREVCLTRLMKIPLGYRGIMQDRKGLSKLAQKGGHAKRQLHLAKSIIVRAIVSNIQSSNKQNGSKKHLCFSKEVQLETSKVLASMSLLSFWRINVSICVYCKTLARHTL